MSIGWLHFKGTKKHLQKKSISGKLCGKNILPNAKKGGMHNQGLLVWQKKGGFGHE